MPSNDTQERKGPSEATFDLDGQGFEHNSPKEVEAQLLEWIEEIYESECAPIMAHQDDVMDQITRFLDKGKTT